MQRYISTLIVLALFCAVACYGQSLGDAARQQRQKEATKDSTTAPKVITNDDLTAPAPEQPAPHAKTTETRNPKPGQDEAAFDRKAEQTKAAILAQKTKITVLQTQIEKERASIHYVEVGVPYNQNQLRKQQAADRMQEQLDEEIKKLTAMQEAARHAGFGSVVYEP